jgi:hypothetical protein
MEELKKEASKVENLKNQLENAGINTSLWGTGQAKTLEHLQKEIDEEETVLIPGENGEILRRVVVGKADVIYISPNGQKFHLKEEKQVFTDGRERQRKLENSVFEKMKPGEDPEGAIVRGIKEELNIDGQIDLERLNTMEEIVESPSYPGLRSQYILHVFKITLTEEQFKEEGYVESQKDKSTYFVWEELK